MIQNPYSSAQVRLPELFVQADNRQGLEEMLPVDELWPGLVLSLMSITSDVLAAQSAKNLPTN